MNTKTIFKLISYMIVGAIFGLVISFGLLKLNGTETLSFLSTVTNFFLDNNMMIFIGLFVFMYLPSVYLSLQGRTILNDLENTSDDDYDLKTKLGDRKLDLSLTLNGLYMMLNFMIFGMTFGDLMTNQRLIVILFMFNIFSSSVLEIATIKFVQKINKRLKGDPTTLKFTKDFLESCDEAEQLTIYKAGYHGFQFTKQTTLAFVVLTILCNLLLDTGGFAVFVSCSLMLTHIGSYSYYAISKH